MLARRLAESVLSPWLAQGAATKLRHAFPRLRPMLRALRRPVAGAFALQREHKIVVVGLGAAALAVVRELKVHGFANVRIVARDRLHGGKCVNYGCMPAEFAFGLADFPLEERRDRLDAFVGRLRADVERQFASFGYRIEEAEVDCIEGRELVLADGGRIAFDRLIVATGSDVPAPPRVDRGRLIDMQSFWKLSPGSRLVIYAEGNVAALSLGEVAVQMGLQPVVLLSGASVFARLPSYRYFVREMSKRGVAIYEAVRLVRAEDRAVFLQKARSTELDYDAFLPAGRPVPRLPRIDGAVPSLYDLDLTRASHPARPDIVFLGDAGGFFTAAQAEMQAALLVRSWRSGDRLELRALESAPLCLHGLQPLAMCGGDWPYAPERWIEVDFRSLGWSALKGLEGKLWYVLETATGRVEALHICHPHAGELISIGAALMEHPVSDVRWLTKFVHPSGAEIFKHLAADALGRMARGRVEWPARRAAQLDRGAKDLREAAFALPATLDLHPSGALPEWIDARQCRRAILSADPRREFAACFARYQLERIAGRSGESAAPGEVNVATAPVHVQVDETRRTCIARSTDCAVTVEY